MPDTDQGKNGWAFVVLLHDEDDSSGLARLLEDVRMPEATAGASFASPPARGMSFFADDSRQAELDQWWAKEVPGDATPVYLLMHEDGLVEWIKGVDGVLYIGVPPGQSVGDYAENADWHTFAAGGPLDFATAIMRDFSNPNNDTNDAKCIFEHGEAMRMAALSSDFPIDLDDSAFDFGPPPQDGAFGGSPPSPFGAPAPPFGGQAPPSPFGSPQAIPAYPPAQQQGSPFGVPAFGAAQSPYAGPPPGYPSAAPPPSAAPRTPAQATTPNPFDLLTGSSPSNPKPTANQPQAYEVKNQPAANDTPVPVAAPPVAPLSELYNNEPKDDWAASLASPSQASAPRQGFRPSPYNMESRPTAAGKGKFEFPSIPFLKKGTGFRSTFTPSSDRDLAQHIVDRGPMLVVMGSRKGGVGKTSYAAGIAIVAGQVLDNVGHKAAIVDANIANPDAWGQMNLREGAATVREVVAALTANREPPPPVHATTPALACYPESRETTEYSKTDIKRFADYLKRRYTFIVVDMSNRLPDPMAGPEAAAAAYWLEHADVLVLPTTSSKQDFNGVLDYLDVRDLPPTVVPYIVPKVKRNREHPVTQQYLTVIRDRVQSIIDVPDEADKVRFAGMEGVPVEQVSPTLRVAYRELTEAIVHVPPRAPV